MIGDQAGENDQQLLPPWYVPPPEMGRGRLKGWRRRVALFLLGSLVLIVAFGICTALGLPGFG